MIKTIKKIDLHGNEVWQEVMICNRCKRTFEPEDIVYTTTWNSACPAGPFRGAYGFAVGSNPDRHFCKKCSKDVENFWEGKDLEEKEKHEPMLSTMTERIAISKKSLECESTEALVELRYSLHCSLETAKAIDLILKDRNGWRR